MASGTPKLTPRPVSDNKELFSQNEKSLRRLCECIRERLTLGPAQVDT